jgi:predicted secreted acid phosphatase
MWGKRFIVLPDAMYGTWENAIYGYERLTNEQRHKGVPPRWNCRKMMVCEQAS